MLTLTYEIRGKDSASRTIRDLDKDVFLNELLLPDIGPKLCHGSHSRLLRDYQRSYSASDEHEENTHLSIFLRNSSAAPYAAASSTAFNSPIQ